MAPRPRAQTGTRAPLSADTRAIAATLNGERAASGLTYDDLAEKAGIPKRSLMRYISPSANRDIPFGVLAKLSRALNISYAELFRRVELRLHPQLEPEPEPKSKPVKKSAG